MRRGKSTANSQVRCLILPPDGMELTLGVYGDASALLKRKRVAVGRLLDWVRQQRNSAATSAG